MGDDTNWFIGAYRTITGITIWILDLSGLLRVRISQTGDEIIIHSIATWQFPAAQVLDMARTLGILVRAGAQAAEKSQEAGRFWAEAHSCCWQTRVFSAFFWQNWDLSDFQEGSDLGRAAYFLMLTWWPSRPGVPGVQWAWGSMVRLIMKFQHVRDTFVTRSWHVVTRCDTFVRSVCWFTKFWSRTHRLRASETCSEIKVSARTDFFETGCLSQHAEHTKVLQTEHSLGSVNWNIVWILWISFNRPSQFCTTDVAASSAQLALQHITTDSISSAGLNRALLQQPWMVGTSRLKIVTNNDKLSFGCSLQADCFETTTASIKPCPHFCKENAMTNDFCSRQSP